MKTVFSSADDTIHVWAQQNQPEGRSKNCHFSGAICYSYGTHYPLGIFINNTKGERGVIINTSGYSVTTAKHIGIARYAVNHINPRFNIDDNYLMKRLAEMLRYQVDAKTAKKYLRNAISEAVEKRLDSYSYKLRNDTKRRKQATIENWKQEALSDCNNYIEFLKWYGQDITAHANKTLATVTGLTTHQAKEHAVKAAAAEARKKDIAEKKRQALVATQRAEAVQMFLAGEVIGHTYRSHLYDYAAVLLRVHGDNIETSKGAEFPVEHGKRAFVLIKQVKESGKGWERNGHAIHLGHFQIDAIMPDGTVKAGCHTVSYSEIERVAKHLGLE